MHTKELEGIWISRKEDTTEDSVNTEKTDIRYELICYTLVIRLESITVREWGTGQKKWDDMKYTVVENKTSEK